MNYKRVKKLANTKGYVALFYFIGNSSTLLKLILLYYIKVYEYPTHRAPFLQKRFCPAKNLDGPYSS